MERLTAETMSKVLRDALRRSDLIAADDACVIFHDLTQVEKRLTHVVDLWPANTLHAVAIKANPLRELLLFMTNLGAGLEAASLPELYLAERCGVAPQKIVFDSPVKTISELEYALDLGVHINADSLSELDRIASLWPIGTARSTIGARINPQVGVGSISTTSVAGDYSKFGIPIKESRRELMRKFIDYPWLTGVHIHVGSQGCPVDLMLKAVEVVVDFVNETNLKLREANTGRQINILDIGGGLPVAYRHSGSPVSMESYCREVMHLLGRCTSTNVRLITEFGRYVNANAGWAVSRVEYVKRSADIETAMIHAGADLFLRECYRPDDWYHEISVTDPQGQLKTATELRKYTLAGPLCFADDIVAREVELPPIEPGDYVIIHATGAYTLSMWSRYNSRQVPKVIGYTDDGESFRILKDRESLDDLWKFWG